MTTDNPKYEAFKAEMAQNGREFIAEQKSHRLGANVKTWKQACHKLNPIKPGETPAEWVWREWCNRQLTTDITISRAVHNATVLSGGIRHNQAESGGKNP